MTDLQKQFQRTLSMCLALFLALGTFSFLPQSIYAEEHPRDDERTQPYVEGEVLVKYRKDRVNLKTAWGKTAAAFLSIEKATIKKDDIEEGNIAVLEIKDGTRVEEKVAQLRHDPRIEYAEPNYIYQLSTIGSNDTHRALLWGLDNTSQAINGTSGTADADIDAPEAWGINEGTQDEAIVAIIDTGVAYNHTDLAANMWDGSQCKDENGAALGNCTHGYDFTSGANNGAGDPDPIPDLSDHGTHIAGTIAAVKNNGTGIIGVAPHAKIMALKADALSFGGVGINTAASVKAIDFARHNGARVINASYGGSLFSQSLYDAIKRFGENGGIFAAAAGNSGTDNDTNPHYPSGYDLENIIAVAATDNNDARASFSNVGASSVDVGAPGVAIYSTVIPKTVFTVGEIIEKENFQGVSPPSAPPGWALTGNWGTKEGGTGVILHSEPNAPPYEENGAGTIATAPPYDASGQTDIGLSITSTCDTEYEDAEFDYLQLEYSGDSVTFEPIYQWNERTLDILNGDSDQTGSANAVVTVAIPEQYRTAHFTYRFRWIVVDELFNNYQGCSVDEVVIARVTQSIADTYEFFQGTSMATPHVAGLAALLKGYKPNLTVAQIKNSILSTGDTLPSLQGKTVTGKRINAHRALQSLTPAITTFSFDALFATGTIVESDHTISILVPFNTDLTALVPTITFTGTSISPASGVAQDFTNPVTYTVTASDGSIQQYTVTTVTMAVVVVPSLAITRDASTPTSYQATDGSAPSQGALTVRLEVSNADDFLIDELIFSTGEDAQDPAVTSATLHRASGPDGPWTQVGESVSFALNGNEAGRIRFVLTGDDRINAQKSSTLLLKLVPTYTDSQQAAVSGLQPRFSLTALHAIGAVSLIELSPDTSGIVGNPITILNSVLTFSLASSLPGGMITGGSAIEMLSVIGMAVGGDATLSQLDVTVTKNASTINVLTLNATPCAPLSEVRWRCVPLQSDGQLAANVPHTFTVRADGGFSTNGTIQVSVAAGSIYWSDGITPQVGVAQQQGTLDGGILIAASASGQLDATRPTFSSVVFTESDAKKKLATGDVITLTFNEPIDPSDIHSSLIPGGTAVMIAQGATGDVALAKTTGVVTIQNIASVDIDAGITPEDTAYTVSASLNASATLLALTLTGSDSGSGLLTANKSLGAVLAVETQVSDVNGNLLAPSGVTATSAPTAGVKKILSFSINEPSAIGSVNQQNHTIALTVPFGTDVTGIVPTIDILGAQVGPASGIAQNFTQPVTYTVTALDGTTQSYTVTVTVAPNTANDITAFSIITSGKEFEGVIDQEQRTVSVIVSHDVDVAALTAIITTTGVSVSPEAGVAQNFSQPVTYAVTAQDGSKKQYTVTVTKADKPAITSFTVISFGLSGTTVQGVIDESAHAVTIVFPFGSDISNLMTLIAFTGVSVNPAQGITPFFLSKIYTVTAQDRSTQSYTVFMSVAKNPTKKITAFAFTDTSITIALHENTKKIIAVAPTGTSVSSLAPAITITGASISPASGVAQDFTQPVTYTVTAQDGSTQAYTVIVKALSSSQVLPGEGGAASATKEKPQVVVTSPDVPITVSVDAAAEDPAVDFGALIENGEGTVPKTTINTTASAVEIPAETTVTSTDTAWNGVLSAPKTVANIEIPKKDGHQRSVNTAVEVGQSGAKLSFDKAVRLVMIGHAGKKAGVISAGKFFAEITTQCAADTQIAGDVLAQDTECAISAGSQLVIWTKHFTTFVVFTETQNQTSGGGGGSSGGGGGGGGGGGSSVAPQAPRPAPPTGGFRVIINNGDAMTSNTTVELSLSAGADTSFVLISNSNNFDNVKKEPYVPKKIWIVADSIGTQTVYVKFLHADGSASSVVSDSILYLTVSTREPVSVEQFAPIIRPFKPLQVIAAPQRVLGTKVRREPSVLAQRLSGRILLQTQEHGEAWYMYPDNKRRYYLGRPHDAFAIMRALGLGAKHDLIARTLHYPERLWGKILLDVEMNGEAYYINPLDARAYYLGRPADAFRIMRELGLGITNENLTQIEVGTSK